MLRLFANSPIIAGDLTTLFCLAGGTMANPFVAEIRPFAFNFAPVGWATCDGQLLPISQNTALFSLLGTNFGGDGKSTFELPDLRGRVPMHTDQYSGDGQNPIGTAGGVETVTLSIAELPAHNHGFVGTTSAANVKRPVTGSAYAVSALAGSPPVSPGDNYYGPDSTVTPISPNTVQPYGGRQPHENRQPYLTINLVHSIAGRLPTAHVNGMSTRRRSGEALQWEPLFLAEIRMISFNFAPKVGLSAMVSSCRSIKTTALFSLIGTYLWRRWQDRLSRFPTCNRLCLCIRATGPGLSNYIVGQTGGSCRL